MNRHVAALDRALARNGETITLRLSRPPARPTEVQVRAFVRQHDPHELVGGVDQIESKIIISPSSLAGWGGPPRKNDKAIIDGRTRNVEVVNPIKVGDAVVRIELQVIG